MLVMARGCGGGATTPHRYDVFERFIDSHVEFNDVLGRHHQKEAGGRIGCGRHVDTDIFTFEVIDQVAPGLPGLECDGPAIQSRILHQQGFPKGITVRGKQRVRNLLDAFIYRVDDRDAREQLVPPADQLLPDEICGEQTCKQNHGQGQQRANAGYRENRKDAAGVPFPAIGARTDQAY